VIADDCLWNAVVADDPILKDMCEFLCTVVVSKRYHFGVFRVSVYYNEN
jgi:hypothetical protein